MPVIQPMPLPCTTYQVSADHLCTITHCSLWVTRGQDLQKFLLELDKLTAPVLPRTSFTSMTAHQLHFRCPWKCWEFGWNTGSCQSTKYRLLSLICCLQHSPRVFCFSKCLKWVTHGKNHALVLLFHLHAPGCLVTFSLQSWELAHIQFLLESFRALLG